MTTTPHVIQKCSRCGESFTCFMVDDKIWKSAGFIRYDQARMCMACFEKQLGRVLTLADLPLPYQSYCNAYWHELKEMRQR